MSEAVVLKFQYKGFDVDLVVSDIDTVNLIDLVIEYEDKARENKIQVSKNPFFNYVFKMKHIELQTDSDLMKMFANLPGSKLIYIWVGELSEPSELMKAVKSLRSGKKVVESNDGLSQPNAPSLKPTATNTPRRSQRHSEVQICSATEFLDTINSSIPYSPNDNPVNLAIEETWIDVINEGVPTSPVRGRGRGRGRASLKGRGTGKGRGRGRAHVTREENEPVKHIPLLHSPSTSPSHKTIVTTISTTVNDMNLVMLQPNTASGTTEGSSKASKTTSAGAKKIPKTTAPRKGLNVRPTSGNSSSHGTDLNNAAISLHTDQGGHNLDDDEMYSPTGNGTDTDESLVSEDGLSDDDGLENIHDEYDPYEGHDFEDDDDDDDVKIDGKHESNYLKRLYHNGEVYGDDEFGKIVLRPWMLFLDKHHLRSVVREHCIQCRFSVVVNKASNTRFTAICSGQGCMWRLHASRLPDGTTWVIKPIQNSEHTCLGLEVSNQMVTCKWAKEKLLDDIRANNDISAKSLNELLWQRYGIQMKQSTIYKMRAEALIERHGGHDVSYSLLPRYCEIVKKTNPESIAICAWTPPIIQKDHCLSLLYSLL
ncbi:uncharacterized protein LOC104909040 [Beta vulgaris subsp. vulgaris]|uniref:uncharacterized protein LOC104909040 n=1 Tax=Beta vulgaris subsp. vulgaris TaxID=3555 RepID=UPI002547FD24|nr:uncharacterized protein LOC104909040 [Beta vulgaris subsp. vulgaris]XP_057247011.1 uncharacterized protein LOC104909040 [Beta vulgaris subsp. vulgaris]XP_057247012.1 uncharacterized protein LOC104909040 [Beta vulgaris subsp. vulgaris]